MATAWRMRRPVPAGPAPWTGLEREWGLSGPGARLAWMRAGQGDDLAWRLDPSWARSTDPFLLEGVTAAVARIRKALAGHEPICVYGDYDVDGVTATALLVRVLEKLGAKVGFFIPNRFNDGYGLHLDCIREVAEARRPLRRARSRKSPTRPAPHRNPARNRISPVLYHLPKPRNPCGLANLPIRYAKFLAGSLSTASHGVYLLFTLPIWLITTAGASYAHSAAGYVRADYQKPLAAEIDKIRKWARFPQGLPPGYLQQAKAVHHAGTGCASAKLLPVHAPSKNFE